VTLTIQIGPCPKPHTTWQPSNSNKHHQKHQEHQHKSSDEQQTNSAHVESKQNDWRGSYAHSNLITIMSAFIGPRPSETSTIINTITVEQHTIRERMAELAKWMAR
jgi:glycogen debranching enzyme